MSDIKLYQWPSTSTIESIYPRAVLFKRICNLAGQKIKIMNVTLPKPGEKFQAELQSRLIHLPVLEVGDAKFTTSKQIIDYFLNNPPSLTLKQRLVRLDSVYGHITKQWANECFLNTLLYARWKSDANYPSFIRSVNWGSDPNLIKDHLDVLRDMVLKYLDRTVTGGLNLKEYDELLKNQLWSLDAILSSEKFFEPLANHPTLTDLYVFMVVQGFMDDNLVESKWIKERYKNLVRWYAELDRLTCNLSPTSD